MITKLPWVCIIPGSSRAFGERLGLRPTQGPQEPMGLGDISRGYVMGPPAGYGPCGGCCDFLQLYLLNQFPPLPVKSWGWKHQECTNF